MKSCGELTMSSTAQMLWTFTIGMKELASNWVKLHPNLGSFKITFLYVLVRRSTYTELTLKCHRLVQFGGQSYPIWDQLTSLVFHETEIHSSRRNPRKYKVSQNQHLLKSPRYFYHLVQIWFNLNLSTTPLLSTTHGEHRVVISRQNMTKIDWSVQAFW